MPGPKYECDCGARYMDLNAVTLCAENRHGEKPKSNPLQALIQKYEQELAAHKSGKMMSLAESVYGKIWCERILEDLRTLEK